LVVNGQEVIGFDALVWAGGFRGLPLARVAGLEVNETQQILVDPTMRSISHPDIYAVGDAVQPVAQPGAALRMGLYPALVTAAHAADSLTRRIKGQQPQPLGFSYYAQGIALGRADGIAFPTFPNDRRSGPMLTGRAALALRNLFVPRLLDALRLEKRIPGTFSWAGSRRGRHTAAPALVPMAQSSR
jgi:NADH dehydrogenase FAD-containing subunit